MKTVFFCDQISNLNSEKITFFGFGVNYSFGGLPKNKIPFHSPSLGRPQLHT